MRARALAILQDVAKGRRFASELLRPDDPPFVRELVLGVLRRRLTLDTIHDAFGKRPSAELDGVVREAVRLGLYQYIFLDGVPPHAAVAETVGAVPMHSHRSYVNGVLRRILRESHRVPPDRDRGGAHATKRFERPGKSVTFFSERVFPDPEVDRVGYLAAIHSHPALLVARWLESVGEQQAIEWMEIGNSIPRLVLRPRGGRMDAEGLVTRLAAEHVPAAVITRTGGPDAVEVARGKANPFKGASFRAGLFSVQAAEQMDAVDILDPQPGEAIWDACAAPGGKTTQIAERQVGQGLLVATDRSERRLDLLRESLQRLGLDGVQAVAHDVLGAEPPPGKPAGGFDAILLDAPCSNTAVLSQRPEARWRLQPESIAELAGQQRRLLAAVSQHLAPEGRLVFSSCSREPEEGTDHGLGPTRSRLVWMDRGAS
jgi:16S rRNA (cytosine967-C5)-methyltransferase